MKNWTIKDWLQLIQTVALIIGIVFGANQLRLQTKALQDTHAVNSATFVLKISDELNKSKYDKIMKAIDDHKSNYPISHKGFSDTQIDEYIGNYETMGNLAHDNIISRRMAYNELGYEIEKAWCNKDVQNYIKMAREADKNTSGPKTFYIGFEELAKFSLLEDKKTCLDMDEE